MVKYWAKKVRNVIFVGMPGAGKSHLGRIYAHVSKRQFLDFDRFLENHLGKPIPAFFAEHGEEAFRRAEDRCLRKLERRQHFVISFGGGTVCREQNLEFARSLGLVVHLRESPRVIAERIFSRKETRPMFASCETLEDVEAKVGSLWDERRGYYERAADLEIDMTFGSAETLALQLEAFEKRLASRDVQRDFGVARLFGGNAPGQNQGLSSEDRDGGGPDGAPSQRAEASEGADRADGDGTFPSSADATEGRPDAWDETGDGMMDPEEALRAAQTPTAPDSRDGRGAWAGKSARVREWERMARGLATGFGYDRGRGGRGRDKREGRGRDKRDSGERAPAARRDETARNGQGASAGGERAEKSATGAGGGQRPGGDRPGREGRGERSREKREGGGQRGGGGGPGGRTGGSPRREPRGERADPRGSRPAPGTTAGHHGGSGTGGASPTPGQGNNAPRGDRGGRGGGRNENDASS